MCWIARNLREGHGHKTEPMADVRVNNFFCWGWWNAAGIVRQAHTGDAQEVGAKCWTAILTTGLNMGEYEDLDVRFMTFTRKDAVMLAESMSIMYSKKDTEPLLVDRVIAAVESKRKGLPVPADWVEAIKKAVSMVYLKD